MKVNYRGERISVGEAAEMLSMNEQKLRVMMQKGKLPIGVADKEETSNNYSYYIYRGRVNSYLQGLALTPVSIDKK